jgi:hypothetical protein
MYGSYEAGPVLEVQMFVIYGLRAPSQYPLHILVRRAEEKQQR